MRRNVSEDAQAIREDRGLGLHKPKVKHTVDQGGHDANYRDVKPQDRKGKV